MAASAAWLLPSLAPRDGPGPRSPVGVFADRRAGWIAFAGVLAVLAFAVVLTASRTGIALLPLVLAGVALMWLQLAPGRSLRRLVPALAALAAVPLVAFAALLAGNTALGKIAERFIFSDDPRRELWRDAWFAIGQAWPFGVGVGDAQPALIAAERLEVLDPTFPNRAHNDYLELALESGLLGLVLLAAIAALLAAAAWRSWRERPDERHLTVLGGAIVLVTALHSFVDYPLRSMALACLMGTGAGLLIGTPRKLASNEPSA
jgi:O-antigen ligase